jgi:adenine/guanine phosphoribosyltransferase-like PRPP-binding protein
MFGQRVVRVPREALDKKILELPATEAQDFLEKKYSIDEWFVQLASTKRSRARAILIDEFTQTGRTLKALKGLCDILGVAVEQSAAVVDFRPSELATKEALPALYRLPMGNPA